MAFIREIELIVGQGDVGLEIAKLDIDFDISRSTTQANNTATFTVYNAKESTRTEILKKDSNIRFKAGYADEGNIGIIFFGTVDKVNSKKQGVDWITTIQAKDISSNQEGLANRSFNFSYKKGSNLSQVINDLAGILSIPVAGVENANIKLNNGFVFVGTLNNLIRKINKTLQVDETQLYFDSNEMVIFKQGGKSSKFGVTRITPSSGLIGTVEKVNNENEDDTRARVNMTVLMNPKLRPNGLINVSSSGLNGSYILEKVRFYGNNYGGDFLVDLEAVE